MSKARLLWVNGDLLPVGESVLNPLDRGFTLGDGLFETLRVRGDTVLGIERHLLRLRVGAAVLGLSPLPKDKDLKDAITKTLTANGLTEAAVRLTISRGVPKRRGLLPEPEPNPSMVIHVEPFTGYPAELYDAGARAVISGIRRNEHSPLARVKSLNYLDKRVGPPEAEARGVDDALLLNTAWRFGLRQRRQPVPLTRRRLGHAQRGVWRLTRDCARTRHCRTSSANWAQGGREGGKARGVGIRPTRSFSRTR
jgi:branched-chain amino acid aminotransferase